MTFLTLPGGQNIACVKLQITYISLQCCITFCAFVNGAPISIPHFCSFYRALSKLPTSANNLEIAGTKSLPSEGLTRRQTRLLRKDDTLAPVVKNAANTVIAACGAVFNQSRWNCSSLSELPHISPELRIGKHDFLPQPVANCC